MDVALVNRWTTVNCLVFLCLFFSVSHAYRVKYFWLRCCVCLKVAYLFITVINYWWSDMIYLWNGLNKSSRVNLTQSIYWCVRYASCIMPTQPNTIHSFTKGSLGWDFSTFCFQLSFSQIVWQVYFISSLFFLYFPSPLPPSACYGLLGVDLHWLDTQKHTLYEQMYTENKSRKISKKNKRRPENQNRRLKSGLSIDKPSSSN